MKEQLTGRKVSVICLGLGSPAASKRALMQLEFLHAILSWLESTCNITTKEVFDPAMLPEDEPILEERGFRVMAENRRGAHTAPADRCLLLYMPNCPMQLYENVIRANWSTESLQNVVLIGNNLSVYDLRNTDKKAPAIQRVWISTRIYPFEFDRNELFSEYLNDMAVHSWAGMHFPPGSHPFWTLPPPVTDENDELV